MLGRKAVLAPGQEHERPEALLAQRQPQDQQGNGVAVPEAVGELRGEPILGQAVDDADPLPGGCIQRPAGTARQSGHGERLGDGSFPGRRRGQDPDGAEVPLVDLQRRRVRGNGCFQGLIATARSSCNLVRWVLVARDRTSAEGPRGWSRWGRLEGQGAGGQTMQRPFSMSQLRPNQTQSFGFVQGMLQSPSVISRLME